MLLLQDNMQDICHLNFNGVNHKLGNFKLAVHNRDISQKISFFFPFKVRSLEFVIELQYRLNTTNDLGYGSLECFKVSHADDNRLLLEGRAIEDKTKFETGYVLAMGIKIYPMSIHYQKDALVDLNKLFFQEAIIAEIVSHYKKNSDAFSSAFIKRGYDTQSGDSIIKLILEVIGFSSDQIKVIIANENLEETLSDAEILLANRASEVLNSLKKHIPSDFSSNPFHVHDTQYVRSLITLNSKNRKAKFSESADEIFADAQAELLKSGEFASHWDLFDALVKEGCHLQSESVEITDFYTGIGSGYPTKEMFDGDALEGDALEENNMTKLSKLPLLQKYYQFVKNHSSPEAKEVAEKFLDATINFDVLKKVGSALLKHAIASFDFSGLPDHSNLRRSNLFHLEAVRANTQRLYTWASQGTGFNDMLYGIAKLGIAKLDDKTKLDFIQKWISNFGLSGEFKIRVDESGIGAQVLIGETALPDFGYGITQFLPIIFKIALIAESNVFNDNYDSKILYIEEPETNLHPKLQSKLADMFVDANKTFNIQFIIETHSEYFIRKLQYLTARKEIQTTDTVIHYFNDVHEERPAGTPQVKEINIQSDGRLTGEFGPGFYDETARLMMAIMTGENLN
jgi:AAA domain, putative AbiEii toxin, Type IV TA system/Protein of unknown function (DUF3696)